MPVPFIDLKRFEEGFLENWNSKTAELSAKAGFIGGPEVAALEETLRMDCAVERSVALRVVPGDELLCRVAGLPDLDVKVL